MWESFWAKAITKTRWTGGTFCFDTQIPKSKENASGCFDPVVIDQHQVERFARPNITGPMTGLPKKKSVKTKQVFFAEGFTKSRRASGILKQAKGYLALVKWEFDL